MINVLIDTNILLDFIQDREHFLLSEQILRFCAKKEINGFMAAHSIPNMFYILRKDFTDDERREILLSLAVSMCKRGQCRIHNNTKCRGLFRIRDKSDITC